MDEYIEIAAQALWRADTIAFAMSDWTWEEMKEAWKEGYRTQARATFAVLGLEVESHTFSDYEHTSEHGGEGIFRYAGQTSRYIGQATSTRLVSPFIKRKNDSQAVRS